MDRPIAHRLIRAASAAVLVAGIALIVEHASPVGAQAGPDLLARGAYLTGDAGQCADCHREGLAGGPNMIPGPPGAPWAKTVPSLRGLTMFKTDAEAMAFLTTGKLATGSPALGPMPGYKFNKDDATAIVAYLRSLKP